MAKSTLTPTTPLDGFSHDYDGVSIAEVTDWSLVSLATHPSKVDDLKAAVKTKLKITLPAPGRMTSAKDKGAISSAADQWLIAAKDGGDVSAAAKLRKTLGEGPAISGQTDNWVQLMVSGPKARTVLERICPIDLDPTVFTAGSAARTNMEHLGTIICRPGDDDSFLLMSASSSAKSFLHAVETSVHYAL